MDDTFSPSRRRLYWLSTSFVDVIEQWSSLPSSQKRPRRRAPYFLKIECVNDIVMAEMEEWLESASSETLRQCARLRYDGEIIPYIRDQLIRGLLIRCDASQRVEHLMTWHLRDRVGLMHRLDSWGIPHSREDSILDLIHKLVQGEGRERDLEPHSTETDTASRWRPRPYSLRPPGQPRETANPDDQTPAPTSVPPPPAIISTPPVAPPSPPPTPPPPPAEPVAGGQTCVICHDKKSNAVFYPCGHQCSCFDCADEWARLHRGQNWRYPLLGVDCPVCRQGVKNIIRTYTI